jgi:hypothetical protein
MKWRKKSITCSLLAGLTALTVSERVQAQSLTLLDTKTLPFPSASGIEYYQNRLYVFGDNAPHLLVLTPDYRLEDSVSYWKGTLAVIDRNTKPDIESAMLSLRNRQVTLYGIGSMSGKKRWNVYAYSPEGRTIKKTSFFAQRQTVGDIKELNIEGCTEVAGQVVLCNRANDKTQKNHLLFWNRKDSVKSKEIILPKANRIAGMSGLHYVPEKDLLLFTASEEATSSANIDGAIGESYLGWIANFSGKMQAATIKPDGFLKASTFSKAFDKQKLESVCVEKVTGNSYLLHLVADNDDGQSQIFKAVLKL